MTFENIPSQTQKLCRQSIEQLVQNNNFNLDAHRRLEIIESLGPRFTRGDEGKLSSYSFPKLPELTLADKVRVRIAKYAADLVTPLWEYACQETNTLYDYPKEILQEELVQVSRYRTRRQQENLESISVYDVPRKMIPHHIMDMVRYAWMRHPMDEAQFRREVNEWWQVYPGGGGFIREIAIKWAAQECLYEVAGFETYRELLDDERIGEQDILNAVSEGPSGYAALAWAVTTVDNNYTVDKEKVRHFWLWWLKWVIPTSWADQAAQNELQHL